jgi:hypothetical protein
MDERFNEQKVMLEQLNEQIEQRNEQIELRNKHIELLKVDISTMAMAADKEKTISAMAASTNSRTEIKTQVVVNNQAGSSSVFNF